MPLSQGNHYEDVMNTRVRKRLARQGRVFAVTPRPEGRAFLDWFREEVLGLDNEAYRRAFWREFHATGHTLGHVPRTFRSWQRERGVRPCERLSDALAVCLVLGCPALAVWLARRALGEAVRHLRRPTYYERERERRLVLGKTRRAITCRRTVNPKPSMDALRAAWRAARRCPQAALRFGGMLEDLECYVDNRSLGGPAGGWRGRRGGIKRLLEREAPDLFAHYAAVMRYKALARRFRQACGVEDPVPADALLPASDRTPPVAASTLLAEAGTSMIALEAALALRLDPDCIAVQPQLPRPAAVRSHPPRRLVEWLRRRMRSSA